MNRLVNNATQGYFDFFSQLIVLNSLEISDLQKLTTFVQNQGLGQISVADFYDIRKFIPLLNHELAHWDDFTSTLWGLELAIHIERSRASLESNDVAHRTKIISASRFLKTSLPPRYYYEKFNGDEMDSPWKYVYSVGRWFNADGSVGDRPIVFTRFSDSGDNPIIRCPMSVLALLECNAMAREIWTEAGLLSRLNANDKVVEDAQFKKRTLELLYADWAVEYNVAVHCLANSIRSKDAYLSFRVASLVSRLCLNFPQKCFLKIELGDPFNHQEFSFSIASALKHGDRGALFLVICEGLKKNAKLPTGTTGWTDILDKNIKDLGISGGLAEVQTEFELEWTCGLPELENTTFELMRTYAEVFRDHVARFGLVEGDSKHPYHLPRILLGDDTELSLSNTVKVSAQIRYNFGNSLQTKMNGFKEVCL